MPTAQQDQATIADLASLHAATTCPSSPNLLYTAPASSGTKKLFKLGRKHRGTSKKQQQLQANRPISLPAQVSHSFTLYLLLSPQCSWASLQSISISDAVRELELPEL